MIVPGALLKDNQIYMHELRLAEAKILVITSLLHIYDEERMHHKIIIKLLTSILSWYSYS